jgi:hypothetical protein
VDRKLLSSFQPLQPSQVALAGIESRLKVGTKALEAAHENVHKDTDNFRHATG